MVELRKRVLSPTDWSVGVGGPPAEKARTLQQVLNRGKVQREAAGAGDSGFQQLASALLRGSLCAGGMFDALAAEDVALEKTSSL